MCEELKPCPFCKREAQQTASSGLVSCAFENCPAFLLAVPADDWNRRAQPAEAEGVNVVAVVKHDSPLPGYTDFMKYEQWMADGLSGGWEKLMVVAQHQSALSAVTAERDRLREQVAALQSGANSWQSGYDKGREDVTTGLFVRLSLARSGQLRYPSKHRSLTRSS